MANIVIGTLIFAFLLAGSIRKAILTSNRKIEAQQQQHKHTMQTADARPTTLGTEQPRKKKLKKQTAHTVQQTVAQENTERIETNAMPATCEPDETFDLRKAVIMAEILKPKYDE